MGEDRDLGIYGASFMKAAETLRKSDIPYACSVCGADFEGNRILMRFFTETYTIVLPEVVFDPPSIPVYEQVLLLHYLTTLGRNPVSGAHVSFKNLPGASFYESAYRRRGPDRIVQIFGNDFDGFARAAENLGGSIASRSGTAFGRPAIGCGAQSGSAYGDVSATLPALPQIEAVVVLFRGDDEFPPGANILYRDDIVNFLPLEDISVLSGLIASRLKRALAGR